MVRARRSEEHLPSSKAVPRPPFGAAKKPNTPGSSAVPRGGAGAKVIDGRGRAGGAAAVGGGRKHVPASGGGGGKRSGKEKVQITICR